MSDRFKYALNGVYRIENFAQHLALSPQFSSAQLEGLMGGMNPNNSKLLFSLFFRYIMLRIDVIDNQPFVFPFLHCYGKPQLYIHSFFNILGKDGQSFFTFMDIFKLYETPGPRGHSMKSLDVLNENNHYLDNGTLSVGYGIHIDGILGDCEIWNFNLNDKFFNPNEILTIEYTDPEDGILKVLHGHRQPLSFHSPHFQNQLTKLEGIRRHEKWIIEGCLQIAHGVRVPLKTSNSLKIASIAHHNKLRNVVQYADQQLVQEDWCPKTTSSDVFQFESCIEFGLRHYLGRLVNHFECLEDMKNIIEKLDIEKMSGEAMKTFMAKIFQLST